MRKQGKSGEHIGKHEKTGRIGEKHRKTCENREKTEKQGKQKNTEKQGESRKNIEKHGKTGGIRGKHTKTRKTGKVKENRKRWDCSYENICFPSAFIGIFFLYHAYFHHFIIENTSFFHNKCIII